ncbi:hypothetical protein FJQ98_16365 [Lysinibacillus agricola]|uniref:Barstar (barnase inhibitor) domain-containing protein n=1 Tax=Lysinibacillus agricola TaxID=2590012 RepID=A0ABX7ARF2_9BACI|nr:MULTISPECIES: hypothetical protein [Lysinibacillus]KOS61494.1 hypothetical protein AN161_18050 [Lysinibacillus sp. FJAT-14222]QQP10819.1 hypothetical protein FJQ98_16365 [Lysinibacillus agricola]
MREWKSQVNGKHLRVLIDEGESFKILQELESIVKRISNNSNSFKLDEYDKEEFEELLGTIESDTYAGEAALMDYIKGENWISNIDELVDDRLSQFYDLCDKHDIWVTV